MKILDRYVLRHFLQAFLVCYVSLAGLYIVFDAFSHLEEFLRVSERTGGLLGLMGSHYAYQSIMFFDRTAGLLALVAAMFTVSWLQRHNEMTALLSAGVSRIRIVVPLIAAAVVISLLGAANRELLIPRFRREIARRPSDLIGDIGQELQPRFDNRTEILIGGTATYADGQRIENPRFLLPRSLGQEGRPSPLVAANAFYHPPTEGRPGGYLLDDVQQPEGLTSQPSLRLLDEPVVITPPDAPDWLRPNQCFVVSEVSFEQLALGDAFRQFSSTRELISALRNPSLGFGADVRVAIHSRIVNPFLDITLLFLGLPLVVSRETRNVFIAIGLCIGVTTLFLLVVIGFQYLGNSVWLDPALAAWAPLMIFVPPAVWLAESMWR
jgi:lipopolysaccharide export system permease protein